MNQFTDTTNNIWRVINRHKRLIIAIVIIATVGYLVFGRSSGLTQDKFQDKIYKVSNGVIDINDSKIEKVNDGSSVYMAKWNGFTITASVDSKDRIIFPYGVIGLPSNQMDEISLGQYQEIMKALSSVADSKLSDEDKELLILNELNFNNVIETGTKHSASKNGIKYELIGTEGALLFMLGNKK
ncbi:hypothetical protein C2145_20645 [Bacillus velezensis]|uniref:hypothetical protein n=1 Tax=Bacillus velezensis TaxID=492670 RepID=UPI000CD58C0A|nr:hypothetical protein [Bacillus velezensis]POI14594.1 hypothetical protein C2145_20645 [Bacillus velezensis]